MLSLPRRQVKLKIFAEEFSYYQRDSMSETVALQDPLLRTNNDRQKQNQNLTFTWTTTMSPGQATSFLGSRRHKYQMDDERHSIKKVFRIGFQTPQRKKQGFWDKRKSFEMLSEYDTICLSTDSHQLTRLAYALWCKIGGFVLLKWNYRYYDRTTWTTTHWWKKGVSKRTQWKRSNLERQISHATRDWT